MMTRKWVSFERDFVADAAVSCLREPRLKLYGNRSSNHRLRCLEDPNDEDEGGANRNRNRVGTGTDVKDEGLLEPGDEEVSTLSNGVIDDTVKPVEEDSPLPSVDNVEGGVEDGGADTQTNYVGTKLLPGCYPFFPPTMSESDNRDRERGRGSRKMKILTKCFGRQNENFEYFKQMNLPPKSNDAVLCLFFFLLLTFSQVSC